MPRKRTKRLSEAERYSDVLVRRYGGLMTKQAIGREAGHVNNRRWQTEFVSDLPAYLDGKRLKYRSLDVALKLLEYRVR